MSFTPDYNWGDVSDQQARIAYYMMLFSQVRNRRVNFETQWEEGCALAWPEYMNTFAYGHVISPGMKRTQYQLDSQLAIASHRFTAIVDYVLTPDNSVWSKICPTNRDLLKDKPTREWFEKTTKTLWSERYKPEANFKGQNLINHQCLGVFGNQCMLVQERMDPILGIGLNYRSEFSGIYVLQSEQGLVNGFVRHFRRDAQQAYQKWGEKIPAILKAALQTQSKTLYNFLEFVHPRTDWMPWEVLTPRGMPYVSCYISVEGYCILEDGGYRTLPGAYGRYMQAPEEDYGRGPLQMVLPAGKSKNSMKRDFLEGSHLQSSPAFLIGDDGMVDFRFHPNALNYGGVSADGKPLIHMVPTGDVKFVEEAMKVEAGYIDDAFLVTLYADLLDDAKKGVQLSARQVVERAQEKGMFMSPLGRQITEYLGPMIARELDILSYQGKLDPMTPAMREARGEFEIEFSSWLGRSAKVQEAAATMQFAEALGQLAQQTGDPSIMDAIEANEAADVIAAGGGVPERVLATMESRAKKAKARAAQAEREARAKEMPAQAAMAKAQAIVAKAQTGGNIGGTLSGTPPGGMPQIPGNPVGTPGQPGIGGQPGQPGQPG